MTRVAKLMLEEAKNSKCSIDYIRGLLVGLAAGEQITFSELDAYLENMRI